MKIEGIITVESETPGIERWKATLKNGDYVINGKANASEGPLGQHSRSPEAGPCHPVLP